MVEGWGEGGVQKPNKILPWKSSWLKKKKKKGLHRKRNLKDVSWVERSSEK